MQIHEELVRQFETANHPPMWQTNDTAATRRLVARVYVAWQDWHIEQFLTEGGFNSPTANRLFDEAHRLHDLLNQTRKRQEEVDRWWQSLQQPLSIPPQKTIWRRLVDWLFR